MGKGFLEGRKKRLYFHEQSLVEREHRVPPASEQGGRGFRSKDGVPLGTGSSEEVRTSVEEAQKLGGLS